MRAMLLRRIAPIERESLELVELPDRDRVGIVWLWGTGGGSALAGTASARADG